MSTIPSSSEASSAASPAPSGRLRGNLNTFQLFFTVLAFNAPLSITVGFLPVIVGYGNGAGAPVALVIAGVILGLFAVGFVVMGRHLDRPGGFYGFVTAGLGRVVGLGSAFVATISYYFMLIGIYAFGGIALQGLVRDTFRGPDVPWWVWMLVLQIIVGVIGYLRLDLSAKVLAVVLIGEVLVVAAYDAVVVAQGGAIGLGLESFSGDAIFSGSIGIALLLAITCFGGFEATVIFRDEVKNPRRTIPRATYLMVGCITVAYAFTTWVFIQSYGADAVVDAAATDPTGSFIASLQTYLGGVGVDIAMVLLATSIFACALSAHNITTRYLFNLGIDGILPKALGRVHRRHGSPSVASIVVSIVALIGLTIFALIGADPSTLYASLIGVYGYTLIVLLLITSVAVPVYLWRHRPERTNVWNSIIAPALAFVGLGVVAVLGTLNLSVLVGGSQELATWTIIGFFALAAVGCVLAVVYRSVRPDIYARIGRRQD